VRAAIEYSFGDKLVCDCLDTARAVANHPSVQRKCVTLDGDVVDPSGTMTGGSGGELGTCLSKLHDLAHSLEELEAATKRLGEVTSTLSANEKANPNPNPNPNPR
jgi:structural maintenance of chromosome 2